MKKQKRPEWVSDEEEIEGLEEDVDFGLEVERKLEERIKSLEDLLIKCKKEIIKTELLKEIELLLKK